MTSYGDIAQQLNSYGNTARGIARQDQADFFGAMNGLAGAIQQQKQDALANQMMNTATPPRAEAVNPGDPAAQAANQQFGGPTPAATGGMQQWQMQRKLDEDRMRAELQAAQIGNFASDNQRADAMQAAQIGNMGFDNTRADKETAWRTSRPPGYHDPAEMTQYQQGALQLRGQEQQLRQASAARAAAAGYDKQIEAIYPGGSSMDAASLVQALPGPENQLIRTQILSLQKPRDQARALQNKFLTSAGVPGDDLPSEPVSQDGLDESLLIPQGGSVTAGPQYGQPQAAPNADAQAKQIAAAVKAGQLTREQGLSKLRELGYQ